MNATHPGITVSTPSSAKMLRAMVGIGVVCALLIVLTFEGTLPRIKKNKAEALEKAIFRVLPGISKKQTFQLSSENEFQLITGETEADQLVFAGYDESDNLVGFAIEGAGMGFADILRVLYGYDPVNQKIIGFYVLESKETPGLGDKIEKDDAFLANFHALDVTLTEDNRAIKNRITLVKSGDKEHPWEVDGITGATISSRAIGNILEESTEKWIPLIYNNQEVFTQINDGI